jgi:glycosyltransferase involved in cell wall biosynthesis
MISIITATWNSYDWLHLLINSLELYSSENYDLIIVDNSEVKQKIDASRVHVLPQNTNIGHGAGLNEGCKLALSLSNPFVMFLDVDCHFLCHGWEKAFIELMKINDVVGGVGVEAKPIRPACMFMKKRFAGYDWRSTPGYQGERGGVKGYDVAISAYYQMLKDGVDVGLLPHQPDRYKTLRGEEFCIDGVAYVHHFWHGSSLHLPCRQADFPGIDLVADKKKLFSQIPWNMV